jgi:hypothetical protein
MADNGPILVTGAAGQLGAVGRTVTGLLLECGLLACRTALMSLGWTFMIRW